MFYDVLMEKKAYKRELAGVGLLAGGLGLAHLGAKQERGIRAESKRIREEMRKREADSPTYKSLEKLRQLGTRRLPANFVGDGDEYKSKLTQAERERHESLMDRLSEERRPYEDRLAANEKLRSGSMRGIRILAPTGLFISGAGLLLKKKGN